MINIQMLVWGSQHVGPAQDLRMDLNPQVRRFQVNITLHTGESTDAALIVALDSLSLHQ